MENYKICKFRKIRDYINQKILNRNNYLYMFDKICFLQKKVFDTIIYNNS